MRQTAVACVAVSAWLFSLCGLSVGCARSTLLESPEYEKDKSADASGDSDAQSDAGDSVPPSRRSDSGPSVGPNPPFEQDASSITCRVDSECPSDDPCEQGICSRSGLCSTVSLPDGEDCTATSAGRRICLDGVCQNSRCGDAFVDPNADESCDDGNSDTGDGCVSCRVAFCGDGFIQRGVEDCDPLNDVYCNADCRSIVCGDGVIDEPIENCEPDISEEPCNEECRISDSPEWMVVPQPDLQFPISAVLLLDSGGNPVVVVAESEPTPPGPVPFRTRINQYQNDGNRSWSVEVEHRIAVTAALDNDDNIVVAGATVAEPQPQLQPWMAKFDSDGEDLWSISSSEPMRIFAGVATDDEANIMALTVSQTSLASPHGIWLGGAASLAFISANGDYNSDTAAEIEGYYAFGQALNSGRIGGVGRYLVAGIVEIEGAHETLLTLVDSRGGPVWNTSINYGVPDERTGFVQAVATSDGDIVALGVSYPNVPFDPFVGFPDNTFLWLERYSPERELRWNERKRVRLDDPLALLHSEVPVAPVATAIDGQDNIYISAHNSRQNVIGGFSIDKYDPYGEPVWERPLRHEGTSRQFPLGLAVDDSGAIYLLVADTEDPSAMTPPLPFPVLSRHVLYKWEQPDR